MTTENHKAGREIVAKDIHARVVDYSETDGQPLLDETGNDILDENANVIHTEPSH